MAMKQKPVLKPYPFDKIGTMYPEIFVSASIRETPGLRSPGTEYDVSKSHRAQASANKSGLADHVIGKAANLNQDRKP